MYVYTYTYTYIYIYLYRHIYVCYTVPQPWEKGGRVAEALSHRRWPPQTQRLRFNQQGDGCMAPHQQTETMSVSHHLKKIVKTVIPKGGAISMISFSLIRCIHPSILGPKPLVKPLGFDLRYCMVQLWCRKANIESIFIGTAMYFQDKRLILSSGPGPGGTHCGCCGIACVNKKHFDSTRCIGCVHLLVDRGIFAQLGPQTLDPTWTAGANGGRQ